jgi:hypothetical protein
LFRTCLRRQFSAGAIDKILFSLLPELNWHHVLWMRRQERVLLILQDVLEHSPAKGLCPPEVLTQLAALRQVNQLRALRRGRELCLVQDLFDRHAIPAVPIDGWTAAQALGLRTDLFEPGTGLQYLVPAPSKRAPPRCGLPRAAPVLPTRRNWCSRAKVRCNSMPASAHTPAPHGFGSIWTASNSVGVDFGASHSITGCRSLRHIGAW